MKRQIVKGLLMLIVALSLSAATSANGQSRRRVTAQIPFDFVVNQKVLPAGEYIVTATTDSGAALRIQSAETGKGDIRLSSPVTPRTGRTDARLVFHRYGDTYFLAEVWQGGNDTGRMLLKTKQEKAMEREAGPVAQVKHQTVEVVAVVQ